jgi:integrase/recombinase XerD
VLAWFGHKEGYRDVRDRALVAFYLASGLRFSEVLFLDLDQVDRYTGWARLVQKSDRERALRALRAYLHVRRARPGVTRLFTTDEGRPFTYWGGQSIFRRLKAKTGLPDLHCHRFRHTWTQTALARGAERAVVQEAMGWTSDAMVRRYGGWVRSRKAAEAMPRFAPI